MDKKAPRRTAQRIQEVAQALCNRFGVTNVSTTQIAAELGISAGNLYYHYRSKDDLITALVRRHEQAVREVLVTSGQVRERGDASRFCLALLRQVWLDRFIYRDLSHLLVNHRHVEQSMRALLLHQHEALWEILQGLRRAEVIVLADIDLPPLVSQLALVLACGLAHTCDKAPRLAFDESTHADAAITLALQQMLWLIDRYLMPAPTGPEWRSQRQALRTWPSAASSSSGPASGGRAPAAARPSAA